MDSPEIPPQDAHGDTTPVERPLAPVIENRFLFVDVASMRAKQLRRGALVRLSDEQVASLRVHPYKPERVAMEEVRKNLVLYETPATRKAAAAAAAAAAEAE